MGVLEPDERHRRRDGGARLTRFADYAALLAAIDAGADDIASAPGIVAFAGPAFVAACVVEARIARPDWDGRVVFDCDAQTGLALEAARLGAKTIALALDAPGRGAAEALIESFGARLVSIPPGAS